MDRTVLRGGLVDVGDGRFDRADIEVRDGRIVEVGEVDARDATVVDCSRFAITPGMVNAHNHSNENWFRGCFDNMPLEVWMLYSYPALAAPKQSSREIYVRTLLGAMEMLRSGATCVVDYLYELAGFTTESLEAVVAAYRDVGLRAVIALGMSDRTYYETTVLDLGLMPKDVFERLERERPPSWSEWETFARSAVERFHRPDEGIAIAVAPSGPQRCTDEMLAGSAALASELDLQVHIHVLETRMQALSGRRLYDTTLVDHLHRIHFLGDRISCNHGIWLTPQDMERVAQAGATIVHNPVSNMKVGDGFSPVPALLKAGVNVALGTDGTAANDGVDMYGALKVAALLHKLWELDYEEWLGATEAWTMATKGGARSAGDRDGLGAIEPGRRADLVLLDLESRFFTPLNNALYHVVFCAPTEAVDSVMVGGRWVVRDRELTGVDERAILAEARELAPAVLSRHDEAFELGNRMLASVRGGWLQALGFDPGVRRAVPL